MIDDLMIEKDGECYVRLSAFFESAIRPALMVPFNGAMVPVIIKELSYAQIRACGDFSLIETFQDKINRKKKQSVAQMVAYAEMQYSLLKEALVSPTYEEIIGMIGVEIDMKEVDALKEEISSLPMGPKRDKLSNEIDALRMAAEFVLPADFVGMIISYALNVDKTDIKKVAEDMLLEAAILAKNNNNSPSDNLPGLFSEFNKVDIDKRSWVVYSQHKKELDNGHSGRRR